MFRKLSLFPSSGVGETPTLLDPLERANIRIIHWKIYVSIATASSLEYQTIDKIINPSNSECYISLSGPFSICEILRVQCPTHTTVTAFIKLTVCFKSEYSS
jgi:hypothetical protein